MAIITLDFETYYDDDYGLRRLTYEEYVRDPRFEPLLVSVHNQDTDELYVVRGETNIAKELEGLELHKHMQTAHNNAFDGYILGDHYGIECGMYGCTKVMATVVHNAKGSMSLANLVKRHGLPDKGTEVHNMKGVHGRDMSEAQWKAYEEYCLKDSWLSSELFKIYRPYFSAQDMNLISETLRWGAVPKFELDTELLQQYVRELALRREQRLEVLASSYNVDTTAFRMMLRSPKVFAEMLREQGVTPPTKLNDKGKETFAFSKTDVDFIELGEHTNPRVVDLYECKVGTQSSIAETRAQRFLEISQRGKMPFPLVPFKAHCVTGDTEVLTTAGWMPIAEWQGGVIAQVTTEGAIHFEHADRYVGEATTQDWFVLDPDRYPVPMTRGHTVPYKPKRSANQLGFKGVEIQDITSKEYALARCGSWANDQGSEWLGKLYCAIQADGTEAPYAYRFHLKKERKVLLLKSILDKLNIEYTYTELNEGADKYFYIPYTAVARGIKTLSLYDTAIKQGKKFIEGYISVIAQFDGSTKDGMELFYTNDLHRANDVATLCALIGRKAKVRSNGDGMWRTVINTTARCADVFCDLPQQVSMEAVPYCTITKTGFWLARYKGFMFVTGNTGRHGATQKINTQNLPKRGGDKTLRRAMIAPKDHVVLTCDLSQVEARRLAALAGQMNLVEQFRAGVDVYSKFGTGFYGREISKATVTERNISKEAVLSLGFGAGYVSFQDRLKGAYGIDMELEDAKQLVAYYRDSNQNIVQFWRQCDQAVKHMFNGVGTYRFGANDELAAEQGRLILADGWILYFDDITFDGHDDFGRPKYSYFSHHHKHRKSLYSGLLANNVTQGSAARIFHWQLLQLRKRGRIMTGAVHDEYNSVVHIKDMFAYYDDMISIMRSAPKWAQGTPVDCEFEIGLNYGDQMELPKFIEQHYDSLLKFHSADKINDYMRV